MNYIYDAVVLIGLLAVYTAAVMALVAIAGAAIAVLILLLTK